MQETQQDKLWWVPVSKAS